MTAGDGLTYGIMQVNCTLLLGKECPWARHRVAHRRQRGRRKRFPLSVCLLPFSFSFSSLAINFFCGCTMYLQKKGILCKRDFRNQDERCQSESMQMKSSLNTESSGCYLRREEVFVRQRRCLLMWRLRWGDIGSEGVVRVSSSTDVTRMKSVLTSHTDRRGKGEAVCVAKAANHKVTQKSLHSSNC